LKWQRTGKNEIIAESDNLYEEHLME